MVPKEPKRPRKAKVAPQEPPLPEPEPPIPEQVTEQVQAITPTNNSEFSAYVTDRIDAAMEKGVAMGFIPIGRLESLRSQFPKTPPMHLKAMILRDVGLRNFTFYLEVLNHFPVKRNNRRLIVHTDGTEEWKENCKSIYEEYIFMMELAEKQKSKYTQFSIPRDLRKTTIKSHHAEWEYLRKTILSRCAPIMLFVCHKQDHAIKNLKLVMQHFDDELIKTLYADVLSTDLDQSAQVRFALPSSEYSIIKRRESHFMTGSSDMAFESIHVNRIWADDWCSWENVDTPEKCKKNKDAFDNLDFLNDGSGDFRIDITNTMHYEDDVNAMYIEQLWGPFICKGAEDILPDGSKIYNFPEVEEYLPKGIEFNRMKRDAKKFCGNILMKPSKRETRVAITMDIPPYYNPFENANNDPIRHVAITLDPAYSKRRKKEGCLQALLLLVNTGSGKLFVHDGYLTRGMSPIETVDRIAAMIQAHKVKELIVETNAVQGWIADSIDGQLRKRGLAGFSLTPCFSSQDKIDNIAAFLEPLIREEKLFIAPHLQEIEDEIHGKSKYVDGMDAVSFARFSNYFDFNTPQEIRIMTTEEEYAMNIEEQRRQRAKDGIERVCWWVD